MEVLQAARKKVFVLGRFKTAADLLIELWLRGPACWLLQV